MMDPKRNLTQAEFEKIVKEMFDETGSEGNGEIDESDDSDSEEHIECIDIKSESEQSFTEDDEIDTKGESSCIQDFYMGRDQLTIWRKVSYGSSEKTENEDIAKGRPGPTYCARNLSNELEAFSKIIDYAMMDEIVKCTNIYIGLLRTRHNYSRERDCSDVTKCEFLAYLGLLFLTGIKKSHFTNVKEIWTTDGTGMEIARAVMSYKRFLFITRCLRFDDKTTREERRKLDKLAAVRKLVEGFVSNSQACYNLSEYTTTDEMLLPFRGRCSFLQYRPNKPAKYGIKMYALCDAKTYYTYNLEVYCGEQPIGPFKISNSPMDIVKRLIVPIEKSNRNLTTNNYYTSIPLADYLLEKKITLIGTLKKNEKVIPAAFLPNKSNKVQSTLFGFQKDKMITSYVPKKNKAVILLSTFHNKAEINPVTSEPEIITDYNRTKDGVDTADRLCATYTISRICKRWSCTIFFSVMNISALNAYIIYKLLYPEKMTCRRTFLKSLSLQLMQGHLMSRAQLKHLPSDVTAFLKLNYGPKGREEERGEEEISPENRPKRGTCRLCVLEKKRTSASMECSKCVYFTCKRHSTTQIVCTHCND